MISASQQGQTHSGSRDPAGGVSAGYQQTSSGGDAEGAVPSSPPAQNNYVQSSAYATPASPQSNQQFPGGSSASATATSGFYAPGEQHQPPFSGYSGGDGDINSS
ncbi:unnamed protein product, partial [Amoebophrya sp. A120]|eukprot:GSA120T00011693001.1